MTVPQLNASQQQAVEAPAGPLCIIAGPGTGKTKTLTARIVHLLQQGTPAASILALAFTNKAAREMRDRVAGALPKQNELPTIATFHGLCHQLLSASGEPPVIISGADRQQLIRELKKGLAYNKLSARELGLLISTLKNQTEPPRDQAAARLLAAYNQALADRHLSDFDDLLLRAHEQLRRGPRPKLPYRHILVDEFQDTNELQYALLKLLATTDNVCVIGDPLQSIYGFRGASAAMFDRFLTDWPQAGRVTLTANYRSVPQVVAVANAMFADAPQLEAQTTSQGEAKAVEVLNEYTEAVWIIEQVEQGVGGSDLLKSARQQTAGAHHRSFKDFAVLYRTHAAAKTLRKCLDESGIPYQVAGEDSPYQRPALATIIAALRYLVGEPQPVAPLTPTQTSALLHPLKDKHLPLSRLASQLAALLGVAESLPPHDLQQFVQTLVRFDGQPIQAFLDYLDAMAEQEFYDPKAEAVTLLTIHAAKGLEFPHVFVLAAEEGVLPHFQKEIAANLDEERRLLYVAATRARESLHVLHARSRGGKPAEISRFITELPAAVLPQTTDPNIAAHLKKRERTRQKRTQTSLF